MCKCGYHACPKAAPPQGPSSLAMAHSARGFARLLRHMELRCLPIVRPLGVLVCPMKVRAEVLPWNGGDQPKVIHALSHESHVLSPVQAAIENTIKSVPLPETPDGYRIVTEGGTELYGWTDRRRT